MLGTRLVDRRGTKLPVGAPGHKPFGGRHKTCETQVEGRDTECFALIKGKYSFLNFWAHKNAKAEAIKVQSLV